MATSALSSPRFQGVRPPPTSTSRRISGRAALSGHPAARRSGLALERQGRAPGCRKCCRCRKPFAFAPQRAIAILAEWISWSRFTRECYPL